jgi:hypothetical protein
MVSGFRIISLVRQIYEINSFHLTLSPTHIVISALPKAVFAVAQAVFSVARDASGVQ